MSGNHRVRRCISALVSLSVFSSLVACRGEPKQLEARSPPPRTPPPVAMPNVPLAPGYGRVVLHGTDGSLNVTARADTTFVPPGHAVPPNRTGDLCRTPCVADLPVGRYKLYLTSADGTYSQGDTDMLNVTEGVNYYVRAPGKFEEPEWIPVLPSLLVGIGIAALLGGGALIASDDEGQRTTGFIIGGGGIALGVVGGILMYDAQRGAIQEGATTTWTERSTTGATP